jgi:hypothetical protein
MRFSSKENRKEFTIATKLYRKSGGAQWRDLQFSHIHRGTFSAEWMRP